MANDDEDCSAPAAELVVLAKILCGSKMNNLATGAICYNTRLSPFPTLVRSSGSFLLHSSEPGFGKFSPPAATRGADATPSPTQTRAVGQAFLGRCSAILVRQEQISHPRHSRDRNSLAPNWLSPVLESDLQGEEAGGQKSRLMRWSAA